jgi:hypothetical protein
MTLGTISFIVGALLLLAGIVGGGIEVKEVRIPKISGASRIISAVAGVVFVILGFITPPPKPVPQDGDGKTPKIVMSPMEWNVDRTYMSYQNFDLEVDEPKACQDACANDPVCKAWTYVRPNTIQGPKPRCWLKNVVPAPQPATCCVSGTKL